MNIGRSRCDVETSTGRMAMPALRPAFSTGLRTDGQLRTALISAYGDALAEPMSSPRSGSTPGETEVAISTDSYPVIATTPVARCSITSMGAVSTGIASTCVVSTIFGGFFLLTAGFFALAPPRCTLDYAFFSVACFAAILCAGFAFALPRFELFLRAATRFFALAMAISFEACRSTSSQHK